MNHATNALTAQDARFRYPHAPRYSIDTVTCAVHAGEVVVIIGPNGSGKSTLLRLMAGLLVPTSGYTRCHNADTRTLAPRQLAQRCAFVAQHLSDTVPLNVRDTVSLGRLPWQNLFGTHSAHDATHVEAALADMDLHALQDRPVSDLSGGERQRVMIARALCQNSPCLLLDEPTSALDFRQQWRVMQHLADRAKTCNTAVLLVSHDLNLAAHIADRILILLEGRLVADGTPCEVLTPSILERVYDCPMSVTTIDSRLTVTPLPPHTPQPPCSPQSTGGAPCV